jgi:hypothetical protein
MSRNGIFRDEQRCVRYVRGLIEQVKKSVSSPLSKLKSISKHQNPVAFENLMRQIGNSANEEEDRKGPVRGDEGESIPDWNSRNERNHQNSKETKTSGFANTCERQPEDHYGTMQI